MSETEEDMTEETETITTDACYTEVVQEESSVEQSSFKETASALRLVAKLGYFHLVERYRFSEGDFGSVNFEDIAQDIDERETKFGDIVGFFHTHPPDAKYISSTDIETARAYSEYFGKRILMVIEVGKWLGGWIVDSQKHRKQIKTFRVPFFHGMYVLFAA